MSPSSAVFSTQFLVSSSKAEEHSVAMPGYCSISAVGSLPHVGNMEIEDCSACAEAGIRTGKISTIHNRRQFQRFLFMCACVAIVTRALSALVKKSR